MRYDEFINSILESRENEYFQYSECHHILPRCLGGTDDPDNLIYLTMREHYLAHKLLVDRYPGNRKLVYALWRMSRGKLEISAEEYEYSRKLYIDAMSKELKGRKFSEDSLRKMSESHKGAKLSDETKKNISKSLIGNQRAKGNQSFLGKHHTEETKEKLRSCNLGKIVSEETKKRISESTRGIPKSEEFKRFMKMSQQGDSHNNYGKLWVNNGIERKLILPEDLSSYLELGYVRGRGGKLNE